MMTAITKDLFQPSCDVKDVKKAALDNKTDPTVLQR